MPLDRQDVEKKDFPIGRRGYEPDAVDAHLRKVAGELETLRQRPQQEAPRGPETLAVVASEQVRAIVEAAETTAAGIQRDAEDQARQITQDANDEADRSRAEAASQARDHVARVSEATAVMLQRVDAMESELGALVESLRTGANRLTADLALLQGNMGELRASSTGAVASDPAPAEAALVEPTPEPLVTELPDLEADIAPTTEIPAVEEAPVELDAVEPEPVPETLLEPEAQDAVAAPAPTVVGDDSEGARLIALNMALNGTPREETDRYLAENFELNDRAGLLNEVYDRLG
ncbi:MAG: DivIVA domain-containing protein [Actinomycetota bacterium]|nr:DivIVA domain-containing protein [Actinomycetota bacterium]